LRTKAFLSAGKKIDRELQRCLPRKGTLAKAMRYSVFAGGKRFRPLLCLAAAKALGCKERKVFPFACAVELVHTFTLIHDDLPAMDNSDFRRGKPTCHKVFGEDIAILAGDALNTLAFGIISGYPEVVKELSEALIMVVEGQVADLASEKKKINLKELVSIHRKKTGALLRACVRGSAHICQASPRKVSALSSYAEHLGLAFQIADDILDVTSTREKIGKPVGADVSKGFPFVIGLAKSKNLMKEEKNKAIAALAGFGSSAEALVSIVEQYVLPV
jgi:geranylgeranyl diphosphate synthase type II